jgi:hypothetical protein
VDGNIDNREEWTGNAYAKTVVIRDIRDISIHKNAYEMALPHIRNLKIAIGSIFIEKIEIEMSDGVKIALDKPKKPRSSM